MRPNFNKVRKLFVKVIETSCKFQGFGELWYKVK